jgi:hypothetical protein
MLTDVMATREWCVSSTVGMAVLRETCFEGFTMLWHITKRHITKRYMDKANIPMKLQFSHLCW